MLLHLDTRTELENLKPLDKAEYKLEIKLLTDLGGIDDKQILKVLADRQANQTTFNEKK